MTVPAAGEARSSSLSRGPFARLWAATASANLADGVLAAAAPLLAASLTRDPVLVAGAFVAQKLPWFVFTLFSGVLVDRLPHRNLLAIANTLRATALAVLIGALALDSATLPMLYVVMFVLGTAETVIDTAALAVLPSLVSRDRLEDANGRIYSTQSVMNELAGPAIGAGLFALTAVAAFALGSAAFAAAGLLFLLLPRPAPQPESIASRRILADIGEGLRWFVRDRIILTAAAMAAVSNLFSSAMVAVLVLYATQRLDLSPAAYGLLLSAGAVGGVAAGMVSGTVVRRFGAGWVIAASNLIPAAAYALLASTTDAYVAGVALALQAAAVTWGNVVVISLRQAAVPVSLLGRVTSAYRLLALGAVPLGGWMGGVLVAGYGLTAPFVVGAVALVALTIAVSPVLTNRNIGAAMGRVPEAEAEAA